MNRVLTFYYRKIKPYFLQRPLNSNASQVPFFILSAGRSGSTLLRKMLIAQTYVNIPPESDDLIPKLVKFYLRYNHKPWEYIVKQSVRIYQQESSSVHWQSEIKDGDLQPLLSLDSNHQSLDQVIRFLYFKYANRHGLNSERWGDKTPFLLFRIPWINMVFPKAKMIFLIRDGRAVVNSYLRINKGYSLETAAERWIRSMQTIEKQQKNAAALSKVIRYEDLVSQPEKEIKEIVEFLGLTFRPESLKEVFLGDDDLQHHKNVLQALSPDNISKWKQEMSKIEIEEVNKMMAPQLRKWNYW